ncbi:MAG TPA: hypothetical protein VHO26_05070 [Propionibacteriaceae bacterium]|nr:hypothetical protein [Propionibacteriaceae bacterium]
MTGFWRSARMGMIAAMLVLSGVAATTTASATTSLGHQSPPVTCQRATAADKSVVPPETVPPNLLDISASTGVCGDQVVFTVSEATVVGYRIGYERDLLGIGSGLPLDVSGRAVLVVDLDAPAYDEAGNSTYEVVDPNNLVNVSGLATVQQVVWAGSLRGVTRVGIGVDRVRPFSVTVDVAKHTTDVVVRIAP